MAKRMSTARRMDRQRANGRVVRAENGNVKRKERATRDAKMKDLIQKGTFPYTPAIMSWASVQLNKPSSQLQDDAIKALAK